MFTEYGFISIRYSICSMAKDLGYNSPSLYVWIREGHRICSAVPVTNKEFPYNNACTDFDIFELVSWLEQEEIFVYAIPKTIAKINNIIPRHMYINPPPYEKRNGYLPRLLYKRKHSKVSTFTSVNLSLEDALLLGIKEALSILLNQVSTAGTHSVL